jgi:hypothetical protein
MERLFACSNLINVINTFHDAGPSYIAIIMFSRFTKLCLSSLIIGIVVFWVVTPYSLIGGTCCLYLELQP